MIICERHVRPRTGLALGMLAAISAALLCAGPAAAQAEDKAAARVLFTEGRDLVKSGKYEDACRKFDAASKLYAGSGVLLNLADCYERINRTASAWTEFGEASSAAVREGRPTDEAEARRRQASLEARLSRLTIHVASSTPGLVVQRDGHAVDPAAWDAPIPVDPGTHMVRAEAPGRSSWSASIEVTEPGKTVTAAVPELVEAGPVPAVSPDKSSTATEPVQAKAAMLAGNPDGRSTGQAQRITGWTLIGAGVVGAGIGGVLGLVAKGQYNQAVDETGVARGDESRKAVSTGNAATAVVVVGAVVAVGGLVVWLAAPHASTAVGTDGTELYLRGTF